MKKLLSILASVGLVATASTSVVSCTKKASLPTYHDVSDISGDFLNDNQVIPNLSEDNIDDANKNLILGTIANSFKNPDALLNNKSDLNISAKQIANYSNGSSVFNVTISDSKNNSANVKMKSVKTLNVLTKADIEPYKLETDSSDDMIVVTLMNLGNEMLTIDKNSRDDYVTIKSNSAELMSLDQYIFNQLAANYSDKFVPGLDDNKGMRFDSIPQQIIYYYGVDKDKDLYNQKNDGFSEWKNVLINTNNDVLKKMEEWFNSHSDISGFYKGWIKSTGVDAIKNGLNSNGCNYFTTENDKDSQGTK